MKLGMLSFGLVAAVLVAGCSASTDTASGEDDLKVHCDPLVCPSGEHFSEKKCACVKDCTEMWVCIGGEHFDADLCKCVPSVSTGK